MHVTTSSKPADIPGYYFKLEPWAKDAIYFIAHEDKEPIGQMALVRKGNRWWIDYLYVREDMRGRGVVRELVKEILPAAAEITDHVLENCEGILPEDLERNSKRYGVPMDILNIGKLKDGRPFTLIRRHVHPLRKKKTG